VDLIGLPWRAAPVTIDEEAHLVSEPLVSALNVAAAKARATHAEPNEVVLAADTLVVDDGDVLGKPADANGARGMLSRLRGREHHVFTGVVLRTATMHWGGVVDTLVLLRMYSPEDIEAYIARGEPFDKAGGYGIQDDAFRPVERVEGCYLNVAGLPLCAVAAGLTTLGEEVERASQPPCEFCNRGAQLVRSVS
jgi:MAF protein